jgi:arylsulfatase A-like enzyme
MKLYLSTCLFLLLLLQHAAVPCKVVAQDAENDHAKFSRPNILWILAEDLSPFMGCYGDPINKDSTPTIDQMASEGVLFKRAFVPAPVCSACRSALITGVMQTTTGTHQHRSSRTTDGEVVPEELRIHLPEGIKTIPELMKEAGYFTFNSGKDDYNFHYDRNALYDVGTADDYKPGMNGWQGNRAKHFLSITQDTWSARPDKTQPWFGQIQIMGGKENAKHVRKGQRLKPNEVPLPPYFPDVPAHRKSWTMHYNAVRGADARVETILDALKEDNQLENTIVFFFSDHGSNHSLRHKQFCYDGGLHIPLIIMGKHAGLVAGSVRNELVSALDISATTLAMAGATLPSYLDGQNLFGDDYKAVKHIVSARDRCDYTIDRIRSVRTKTFRYIRNHYPDRAMLQPQYRDNKPEVLSLKQMHKEGKLSDYQSEHWFGVRPTEELYNIDEDPHQMTNLATEIRYHCVLQQHRDILDNWIRKTKDKGQVPENVAQLRATYELWKDRPIFRDAKVNPEYDQFRKAGTTN